MFVIMKTKRRAALPLLAQAEEYPHRRFMDLLLSPQINAPANAQEPVPTVGDKVRAMLISWEIYPIILIAAFLRLFNIDKAIFGQDEADVYQLARDAIVHGLIPLTSNRASIGNLNPPMVVYFFMIPAAFSANPFWGQAFVALLNTLAVLLTYFFTRRYYGRLAGTIAAALFATSVGAWMYSRFIWSPNIEPFLVVIFLWLLFRGVVERRKGWLAPVLVLLGILYQLHASTLYLVIPLGAAVIMAFKTIRWRDIGYALLGLLLVFAPFLIWEFHNGFFDLKSMLTTAQGQAVYSFIAVRNYLFFIHPTLINPYNTIAAVTRDNHLLFPGTQSVLITTPLHYTHILLQGGYGLALLFLFGGMAIAAVVVLFPQISESAGTVETASKKNLLRWWADFQATPLRQGLLLLLLWQVAPLALFIRHSLTLFDHYFIFLLPGQFILMSIAVVQIVEFIQKQRPAWERWARYTMSVLAALLILAQLIGTGATLIDLTSGNFNDQSVHPSYVDLHSQQNALQEADQLAQQRDIHRIYVSVFYYTYRIMTYLAEGLKTPIELNDGAQLDASAGNCLLLPNLSAGPVVFLAEPNDQLTNVMALLNQYTNATLISTPPHLGGMPYKLYILTAKPSPVPVAQTFGQGLKLLASAAFFLPGTRLLTTRWQITNTQAPELRTTYHYKLHIQSSNSSKNFDCQPTSTWTGDQLFVFQDLSTQHTTPAQINIQATTFTSRPTIIQAGPLTLTSFYEADTSTQYLLTANQKNTITLPVRMTP